MDVSYAAKGLTKTPKIFTSIYGTSHIWTTTGATSIYNASNTGFRVYLQGLTVEQLNTFKTVLEYMIVPQE